MRKSTVSIIQRSVCTYDTAPLLKNLCFISAIHFARLLHTPFGATQCGQPQELAKWAGQLMDNRQDVSTYTLDKSCTQTHGKVEEQRQLLM